jgi:glycosyltransferase involved in cell wall biosynthesis
MTSMAPLVSVLVPIFNEERYIRDCILSVLNQDYPNLEVICFDDCSTDRTVAIVEGISDPRLTLIKNPVNEKHEKTWNHLLTLAKGEYIKTICSDDLLEPTCVSDSVRALEEHPECIMAFCGKKIIDPEGREFFAPLVSADYFSGMSSLEIMRRGLLRGTNLVGEPNNVLFRARLLDYGIRYRFENYWMVDPDFYIQLAQLGPFAYVPKRLTAFRISPKSWSVIYSYKQASSFLRYVKRDDIRSLFGFSSSELAVCTLNAFKLQLLRQAYYVIVLVRAFFYNLFRKAP